MSDIFASGSNHSTTHCQVVACSSLDKLYQEGKQWPLGILCAFTFYAAVKFYYLNPISNTEQEKESHAVLDICQNRNEDICFIWKIKF